MNIVAIIPARGGSKRIPLKNIKKLGDKPLIAWTINLALSVHGLKDILVSTDSVEIANISKSFGVTVPWLRPKNISLDDSGSADVVIHALDWYENSTNQKIDAVLLLQPTSPFRDPCTVESAIEKFKSTNGKTLASVSQMRESPKSALKIIEDNIVPMFRVSDLKKRSQEKNSAYYFNGAIYLIKSSELRKKRSFITGKVTPFLIQSRKEALDIDDQWDWELAEYFAN